MLLGSACIKAVGRTLMKLSPAEFSGRAQRGGGGQAKHTIWLE